MHKARAWEGVGEGGQKEHERARRGGGGGVLRKARAQFFKFCRKKNDFLDFSNFDL